MIPCLGKSTSATTGFAPGTGCVCSQGSHHLFQLCFPGQDRRRRGPPTPPPPLLREVRQQVRVTTPPALARESKAESTLPCLGRRKRGARSTRCRWVPIPCCKRPARASAAAPSTLQRRAFPSHVHAGSCAAASPAIAAWARRSEPARSRPDLTWRLLPLF